jgi:outer membrane protein OmpA-like peptidoglycan-associated protein
MTLVLWRFAALPVAALMVAAASSPAMPPAAATPLPKSFALDHPCPAVSGPAVEEGGIVPLAVGLTLTRIWNITETDPDRESLTQVTALDPVSVMTTTTGPSTVNRRITTWPRRLCRADLRDAYLYHPSTLTAHPDVIGGSTMFSLSSQALRQLQQTGRTRHRLIRVVPAWQGASEKLDIDREGLLGDLQHGTMPMLVNDRVVDLPVLKVSGMMGDKKVQAAILDDPHLPLVLDYFWPEIGYRLRYTKISYPGVAIERMLSTEKRVDIYGIYFDFAEDTPRAESEPVLREIAELLKAHPDWTLAINGHTDNLGGAASNLTLSQRRAAAVRRALVERFGIEGRRLTTAGFGLSAPKDTNDTIEGRARNRRVELVRQ